MLAFFQMQLPVIHDSILSVRVDRIAGYQSSNIYLCCRFHVNDKVSSFDEGTVLLLVGFVTCHLILNSCYIHNFFASSSCEVEFVKDLFLTLENQVQFLLLSNQ